MTAVDNSSPPRTVNPYAAAVNRILSALIEGAGEGAVETAIYAATPWLSSIPVVSWIWKKIVVHYVAKYGHFFYEVAAKLSAKIITHYQANSENSDVKQSGAKLQDAIASGDKDAISKAEQEMEDAWGNLIHMDGAAPP